MRISHIFIIIFALIILVLSENKINYSGYQWIIIRKKNTFNYFINSLKYKDLNLKIKLADKFYSRNYILQNFKQINVIPLIYTTSNPEDLLKLTINQKCVIKASNGSGFNKIVSKLDSSNQKEIYQLLKKWINTDYRNELLLDYFNEPQYQRHPEVTRMIIIEQYMGKLNDIKFHVAYGKILFIQVNIDRFTNLYDKNWKLLPFEFNGKKNYKNKIPKPKLLSQVIDFCYQFYQKIKLEYVRLDLYEINNKIYFGEITFTSAGSMAYISNNYEYKLYQQIKQFKSKDIGYK